MSENVKMVAERRKNTGTAANRRLRKQGRIPGNVYGHGQEPISIDVPAESLNSAVHGGVKVLDLEIEGQTATVMFRELQWDTFGQRVKHFDLLRVAADERLTVEIPIELRGVAPGTLAGGVLETQLRSLKLECLAHQIPESITVRIGKLEIGDSIHVSDLEFPEGAEVITPPESLIVQVAEPVGDEDEAGEGDVPGGGPAEPEVIGRKAEESEDE